MFSKTGSTLKAIAPDRLASEAEHFPYGETEGTPASDTKDYFATYRRDGTGLDYAWNRYYSPTTRRFTRADPYEASTAIEDPQTWNRYAYVANNPISYFDPPGLRYFFARWTECGFTYGDRYCYDYEGYFFDPISSSGGGGGEPGPEPPAGSVRLNNPRSILNATDAAKALKDAFEKWKNCAKLLATPIRGAPSLNLVTAVASLTFADGWEPGMMNMAGGTDNHTFQQAHAQNLNAFASVLYGPGGRISTTVVLWANFFGSVSGGQPNPLEDQQATLVHESIHALLKLSAGADQSHKSFFNKFGKNGLDQKDRESTGDAIARWMKGDCK